MNLSARSSSPAAPPASGSLGARPEARGWRVFATARKPADIARLEAEDGVESLYLDYAEPARSRRPRSKC